MSSISEFQYQEMLRSLNRNRGTTPPPEIESDLHRDILEYCEAQWPRWKYDHSRMDKRTRNTLGVPDFIIALPNGRTIWVECKRPGEKLSSAQQNFAAEMAKLGHTVHIVHTIQEFLQEVEKVLQTQPSTNHQP